MISTRCAKKSVKSSKMLSVLYLPLMKNSKQTTTTKSFFTSIKKGEFITNNKKNVKEKKLGLNLFFLLQNTDSFKLKFFSFSNVLHLFCLWTDMILWSKVICFHALVGPRPFQANIALFYLKFLTEQKQSHCRKKQWNKGGRRWWTSQGRCRCQTMVPRRENMVV